MGFINRVFNLRPGDFRRGLPLFAYYFLIISGYLMGRAARDALFLDQFKANELPYVDIAVAALVGFIVAFYIRMGRLASVRNLQVACLLFFAANLSAFWYGFHFHKVTWLPPVFYIWVGIFGVLVVTQVWTLANFVWTTREAKRLFGILGSGGIAGGIAGGFLTNGVATHFGTEAILLVMALFLIICAGLVVIIWSQKQAFAGETEETKPEEGPRNLIESFRLVRESPHLQAIAALICVSSIVTTAAGWQLKALAKETLIQKDAIAAFFGSFYGYTGIIAFIAQLVLTTKLLRRFGVGAALLILPLSLTAGSTILLVWGTLWAATVLKASDQVFRYSIDTSALQLLYLPVPANVKLQVKSFIDTVIWRFGDGLAGLTVLVFATNLHFTARQLSWVNIVLLGAWLLAAYLARRSYVGTLNENIQKVRIRPEQVSVPVLDAFTTNVFAAKLNSPDHNEILYALTLFEMGQQQQAHSAVKNLLEHPSPHVRKKAISIMSGAGDHSVRHKVKALLRDDNLEVRTEALLYLTLNENIDPLANIDQLGDFGDFSIRSATIAFLAKPGEAQNIDAARMILDGMVQENSDSGQKARHEAARLIGSLPDYFESQLSFLIQDADPEVARQAIRSAGTLRKRRFVSTMIERLGDPKLAVDTAEALSLFEDSIIGTLRDHLNDRNEPVEIRREIPQVLLNIGTYAAAGALSESLLQADTVLRFRILSALNKLHELRRNLPIDKQIIETAMTAEVMGHYRSYQILGGLGGTPDAELKESLDSEMERIFRLMKLLFPTLDLQRAYLGIQSSDPVMHSNALEFLDNTLNPQLRTILVPLIDSEVSIQERIRLADRFLGFSVRS